MKFAHAFAAAALLSLLSAGTVNAGHPHDHGGLFLGFNLGAGTADISSEDGIETDRDWGGTGNVRIGGAIKNNLLLGAEFTGWTNDLGEVEISLSTVLFCVTYYPTDQGFFLRGGMGFGSGHLEQELPNGFTQSKDETGFGLGAAMGYEWRLTRKFALGPQVEFVYLNVGGDFIENGNYFDATLGFNWYW